MYFDSHRGEYITPNRHFSPRLGRWTQPDPWWGVHNMQSSTIAILQAANLFVFTMNNPIRWLDPLGLFATTHDLFNMSREDIRIFGGSYGINSSGNVSTITFNGTTFRPDGTYQVNGGSRHNVSGQDSNFITNTVMGGVSERIFLGAHGGIFQNNPIPHLHIAMFITASNRDFWDSDYFRDNSLLGDNIRFAFISGGAFRLVHAISEINRADYINRSGLMFLNPIYSGEGMVTQLFAAHHHFMDNHSRRFPYAFLPAQRSSAFNSTSITISLLNAVGLDHGLTSSQQRRAIGIRRHIAPSYFGR